MDDLSNYTFGDYVTMLSVPATVLSWFLLDCYLENREKKRMRNYYAQITQCLGVPAEEIDWEGMSDIRAYFEMKSAYLPVFRSQYFGDSSIFDATKEQVNQSFLEYLCSEDFQLDLKPHALKKKL